MRVGILKETIPGERRVAVVPSALAALAKKKLEVLVEAGAGVASGYLDEAYTAAGAKLAADRQAVFADSDVVLCLRGPSSASDPLLELLGAKHTFIGFLGALTTPELIPALAKTGAQTFAMELMPRISRAQSMDALSSMQNLAGYKAVLLAANQAPKVFPMMMTAAGTIAPARVLVLGAGVAGLQAIATAKRLGAVVEGYDIRPEVKEQVLSVGGKFIDLGLDTQNATDAGGYAKAQTAEMIEKQQAALAQFVRAADVVITTAQVPGKRAPRLLTAAMQKGMRPGSVIVDLAAETGGNCELSKPGEEVLVDGVTVLGPLNVPSSLPFHASQLYAKNITSFLLHLVSKEGVLAPDDADEIVKSTLVSRGGAVVHPRLVPSAAQKSA